MDKTCAAYLYAKIDMYAKEKYDDLGFMTKEQIRKKILNGNFTSAEAQNAIVYCLKNNKLDLYYGIKCPDCGEVSHVMERDYSETKTLSRLTQDGFRCDYCEMKCDIKDQTKVDISRKYCISHKELGM